MGRDAIVAIGDRSRTRFQQILGPLALDGGIVELRLRTKHVGFCLLHRCFERTFLNAIKGVTGFYLLSVLKENLFKKADHACANVNPIDGLNAADEAYGFRYRTLLSGNDADRRCGLLGTDCRRHAEGKNSLQ